MSRSQSANTIKGSAISNLPKQDIRLPSVLVEETGVEITVSFDGVWTTRTVGRVDKPLRAIKSSKSPMIIDCSKVTLMDTAGAWMVRRLQDRLVEDGTDVKISGLKPNHKVLFDAVYNAAVLHNETPVKQRGPLIAGSLAAVGKVTEAFYKDFMASMNILGAAVGGSQLKSGVSNRFSFAPVVSQIHKMGVGAIPIIVLMSFIMGAIIAQQGAFQLRYFGAEIFVVDLVGILVLREIGVIITAIMIAGRSGSAITAEIGSMKMREEIDALKVIGLNPVGVLIFPRLVALVISLPLLTFISNVAALGGAMLVAQIYSGISPDAFLGRMNEAVDLTSFFAGIIKAPFMAIIIGVIASVEGMKVGGSAESLGARVTASVVKAIFVVIVVDGLFAMFFAAVDF